jgi:hypothetical protein
VVQLANQALDEVRRAYWNELRRLGDQQAAKRLLVILGVARPLVASASTAAGRGPQALAPFPRAT